MRIDRYRGYEVRASEAFVKGVAMLKVDIIVDVGKDKGDTIISIKMYPMQETVKFVRKIIDYIEATKERTSGGIAKQGTFYFNSSDYD